MLPTLSLVCVVVVRGVVFCFFKQKTAYEMRISDWSSDVCSSDLRRGTASFWRGARPEAGSAAAVLLGQAEQAERRVAGTDAESQIGRASCRERVCQYV